MFFRANVHKNENYLKVKYVLQKSGIMSIIFNVNEKIFDK